MVSFSTIQKTLKTFCPCCFWLLCTEHEEHKKLKGVVGFFYGVILGIILYFAILLDLEFGKITTLCIGILITIFLAVGNACSTQIRCVTLLTLPSFCGKSGRGVLKTIVLAYVLGGPFMNISNNAKEAVRVFGCTTTLAYNLSKTRYEIMVKPFQDALYQMKHDANEVADTLRSVQEVIEPVVEEVEGEEEVIRLREENDYLDDLQQDSKRSDEIEEKYKMKETPKILGKQDIQIENSGEKYERQYKRKLEYRCQNVISKGAERCRVLFGEAYDKCYEQVSVVVAWLLCWPMKLTFLCNLAQVFGGKSLCDPSQEIEPGFGEGYETLKNLKSTMGENLQDVNIQLEVKNPEPKVDVKSAADVARKITKTFEDKKNIFDVIILLIKRLLAFIFLRIVYKAAHYHDKYLTDIEYDNKYITKYFRHIDERRRRRGQKTLLPMKKIERQNFIDPYTGLPMNEERKRILGQSFKLVLEMITATTFILLDRLFYETLDIVSKHALVEYTQSGEHDMSITVKGTGLIANLVRSIVKGFNFKRRVRVIHSNKRCLPRPVMLSNYYLYKIYGTYFLIWLFILTENYTQRLNRAICGYFYRKISTDTARCTKANIVKELKNKKPETRNLRRLYKSPEGFEQEFETLKPKPFLREKKRILYLYNETLKRRIGFFRYMKAKIRRQAKEINLSFEANILLALRLRNRQKFDWLRFFPMGKRKCLICGEPEPAKRGAFYECVTPGCNFVHCWECWRDVDQICYGCYPIDTDDDSAGEDEDLFL